MFHFTLPANLKTNIDSIDRQHLTLLITSDNILTNLEDKGNTEELTDLLNFLISYTETHFADEEEIMKQANYPGFEAHKAEHDSFRMRIESMSKVNQLSIDNTELITESVNGVKKWIIDHVFNIDIKMAEYINKHNESKA
ncbi:MAG: hypothetical protein C0603_03815 [Denitrovibrio sp.]|nr:MAG: hypothetical protein C0603_03815 [Denitrovibrio sp.]